MACKVKDERDKGDNKRKRKVVCLETKITVIKQHENE
jgi:hypothetical protein